MQRILQNSSQRKLAIHRLFKITFLPTICLLMVACSASAPPNPLGWNWKGRAVVCHQRVNFDKNAQAALPDFSADLRRGFCARTTFYLTLHREFGDRTAFFGVAAMTTAGLAALYSPAQQQTYSPETWAFLARLSASLEQRATVTAARLRAGYAGNPNLTRELLDVEQSLVQTALQVEQKRDLEAYGGLLAEINKTLNPSGALVLAAINSQPFYANYLAAITAVRGEVGGPVRFDRLDHRVQVGLQLAELLR
ncbi:MAG: hypothetical protein ACI861_002247 [Paracoccaceae bacterium]